MITYKKICSCENDGMGPNPTMPIGPSVDVIYNHEARIGEEFTAEVRALICPRCRLEWKRVGDDEGAAK